MYNIQLLLSFFIVHCYLAVDKVDRSSNSNILNILYLSDFHIDIFYDSNSLVDSYLCKKILTKEQDELVYDSNVSLESNDFGKFGCDTNKNLLTAILDKALLEQGDKDYDAIIILGDTFGHLLNKDKKNILKNYDNSIKYLSKEIKERFPLTKIYFTFGNNDFTTRYGLPDSVESYNMEVARMQKNLIHIPYKSNYKFDFIRLTNNDYFYKKSKMRYFNKLNTAPNEFKKIDKTINIKKLWYSEKLSKNLLMIFVNSVLFSVKANLSNSKVLNELAYLQLKFIKQKLLYAKKNKLKVILNYHVPIHSNFYNKKIHVNWKFKFAKIFDNLCLKFKNTIIIIFSSHLHVGGFSIRKTTSNNNYLSIFQIPGVSPSNNSNPGFTIVNINKNTSNISSIVNHYLDLDVSNRDGHAVFQKYDIKEKFGIKNFGKKSFLKLMNERDLKDNKMETYLMYEKGIISSNNSNVTSNESSNAISDLELIKCSSYVISNNEIKEKCGININ